MSNLLIDSILAYMIAIILPAELFADTQYFIYALISIPLPILFVWYLYNLKMKENLLLKFENLIYISKSDQLNRNKGERIFNSSQENNRALNSKSFMLFQILNYLNLTSKE